MFLRLELIAICTITSAVDYVIKIEQRLNNIVLNIIINVKQGNSGMRSLDCKIR